MVTGKDCDDEIDPREMNSTLNCWLSYGEARDREDRDNLEMDLRLPGDNDGRDNPLPNFNDSEYPQDKMEGLRATKCTLSELVGDDEFRFDNL